MPTRFLVLVTGSPSSSQAHLSALRFSKAVVAAGHTIESVFFYQEAVAVANRFNIKPNDEAQLAQDWQSLASVNQFELQVCIAAANRRGIVNAEEASQHGIDNESVNPAFSILGLGQLAAALSSSEVKLVQFK